MVLPMQASGEYMLSTTVQASPDCCLSNLMFKADKHGSILSTAAFMEVLEDNGDMQVGFRRLMGAGLLGFGALGSILSTAGDRWGPG